MMISQASKTPTGPQLHVFEQAGGWHWGITVQRALGSGFKVIAYSEQSFPDEDVARIDGSHTLAALQAAEHAN